MSAADLRTRIRLRTLPLRRVWHRIRPWWNCRHCGDQTHSFRCACGPTAARPDRTPLKPGHERRHVAHRHGDGHCEAPCPRYRRCRCVSLCQECGDAPATAGAWFNGATWVDLCAECFAWWENHALVEPHQESHDSEVGGP